MSSANNKTPNQSPQQNQKQQGEINIKLHLGTASPASQHANHVKASTIQIPVTPENSRTLNEPRREPEIKLKENLTVHRNGFH